MSMTSRAKSKRYLNRFDPPGGVTRALNITYLRPLKLPATVRIDARVAQNGRMASLVVGSIRLPGKPQEYCICEHHKMQPTATGRKRSEERETSAKL